MLLLFYIIIYYIYYYIIIIYYYYYFIFSYYFQYSIWNILISVRLHCPWRLLADIFRRWSKHPKSWRRRRSCPCHWTSYYRWWEQGRTSCYQGMVILNCQTYSFFLLLVWGMENHICTSAISYRGNLCCIYSYGTCVFAIFAQKNSMNWQWGCLPHPLEFLHKLRCLCCCLVCSFVQIN